MAKCEVTTTTKQVMTTVEEKQYVLTISQEQAEFIRSFVGLCAGKERFIQSLFDALDDAGVQGREILVDPSIVMTKSGNMVENGVLQYVYVKGFGDYKE